MFRDFTGRICLLIVVLTAAQSALAANRYALVVGIDEYPKVRQLTGSVRDAERVAQFFTDRNFTEVRRLTNRQATRAAIFAAFAYFQNRAQSGDTFYFYFSGHGTVFPDDRSEERDELLSMVGEIDPQTGKPAFPRGKYDVAICPYDHKANTSRKRWGNIVLDDELFGEFAKFAARDCFSILISDSCYSGSLGRSAAGRRYRFLLPEEAYDEPVVDKTKRNPAEPAVFSISTPEARAEKLKGRFLALTAAADTQPAEELYFDSVRGEMGIFTYYLLELLKSDSEISFADLAAELGRKVKAKNRQQTVQIEKRFFQGDLAQIRVLP